MADDLVKKMCGRTERLGGISRRFEEIEPEEVFIYKKNS